MHIVVTGGTGFIGQYLIAALLAAQHRVTVITRAPQPTAAMLNDTVTWVQWPQEPASPEWAPVLRDAEGVIHLAGASIARRWTPTYKQRIISSRTDPTDHLVQAIAHHASRPPVLLSASAVGYYGPQSDPVAESAAAGDDFLATVVQQWEQAALTAQHNGSRVVLLRTGVFLSPDGGVLQRMLLPFKLFIGGPLGDGTQWLPWIHRADWVRLVMMLLQNGDAHGPFNVCAPQPVTMNELAHSIGRELGRPSFMRVPAPLLRLALGEMAAIVLQGQRAVPTKALDLGFQFEYDHVGLALNDLLSVTGR